MIENRVLRPRRLARRPWTVQSVETARDGSHMLRLLPSGHGGLAFRPGQYAWITLGDTPWRLQQHPFSISSSADDTALEFTIKPLGDFTRRIGAIAPGTRAFVEGPYGEFVYLPDRCPEGAVFIAGGVGITPIMSMLRTARDRGATAPLWLVYGNPCWDDVLFRDALDALTRELPLTVLHVLEDPPEDWDGETGHIDGDLLDRRLPDLASLPVYVCGPDALANAVEPALIARGVTADRLYSERFDLV